MVDPQSPDLQVTFPGDRATQPGTDGSTLGGSTVLKNRAPWHRGSQPLALSAALCSVSPALFFSLETPGELE